jgi:CPA1 family monovalent cation:H+ antiporter
MIESVDVETLADELALMLLGAALLAMLAWRIHVPYAVVLVIAGVAVAQTHFVVLPQLRPSVLLFVFLPPLLFDAAFRIDDVQVRRLAKPILWLAIPGTLATALIVGLVMVLVLHLPAATALLFGAIVAATDPVAVVGIFRNVKASEHLSVLIEGESLVNDGVAITLYTAALGLVAAGSLDLGASALLFVREVVGGVLIGVVLGLVFSRVTAIIDDHLVEMTLSTGLAYGSYLLAQSVETSGALACVAAGLVHGSYGRKVGMTERTRALLDDLWEYSGFVVNALVFLLVGFTTDPAALAAAGGPVLAAIVSVLLARVLVVTIPPEILRRTLGVRVFANPGERAVLIWGGLRGALTITLALALPQDFPQRDLLIAMAFGVVLFTLVVLGVSLPWVIRRSGLSQSK